MHAELTLDTATFAAASVAAFITFGKKRRILLFSVTELHVRSYSVHKLRKLFAYFCSLSNGMEMASVNIVSV